MRLRYFGGSTNHWGNYCRPLDAIDFESRDWVPYSGWPFDKAHLDPYYERAQVLCQLGPFAYDTATWETPRSTALRFASDRVRTSMFQVRQPPTRFGAGYRDELQTARNLTTLLHANVVNIETHETLRTVSRLRIACLSGNAFWVSAKWVVLAAGGIENARLLLLSNETQASGLGNENGLVGRFFMGHPMLDAGIFFPSDPFLPATLYYEKRPVNHVSVTGHLTLSPETQRQQQLLNLNLALLPVFVSQRSVMSLRRLLQGQFDQLGQDVRHVVADLDGVAATVYRQLVKGMMPVEAFKLASAMEQTPNPESRVTLAPERDAFGKPQVRLNWQLSDLDIQSLRRSLEMIGAEMGRAGFGRLQITLDEQVETWPLDSGGHHMGSTRMHPEPTSGVVDAQCRVHHLSNLFISGSSVFPTTGHANPTLTIVALAIRLADHLKRLMT
jgi:choline dehydrogenase-like flavoprotein